MRYKRGSKEAEEKQSLEVLYQDLPKAHYVDINGKLNPFTSDLLWKELYKHHIIDREDPNPEDGFFYLIRYLKQKAFKTKSKKLSKKVILDFRDAIFEGVSAVTISLEAKRKSNSQLEILANEKVINTFKLYRLDKYFNFIKNL